MKMMCLLILHSQVPFSQTSLSFEITNRHKKATALCYTRLERLARNKHSSLMGPFESYEENAVFVVNTLAGTIFTKLHFLSKLQTDPKGYSIMLHLAGKVDQEQTL
jgi:hypothetical protein